jgi:4-amino-4-deoxy-L-arabinose transferase-like glycosyltransferase
MKYPFWRKLAAILALAFILRLGAGWVWQSRLDGPFGLGDSASYWALGLAVAEGKPYEHGLEHAQVFRTPGYPILLAPILRVLGDNRRALLLARAEAALLGTLAVAAVWWLTRLLFDDRAALLAAALATFYPGAIVLSVLVLSEAPFCPLMLLNLGLWIAAWQAQGRGRTIALSLAGGVVAGAATLMRPSWLLFTPFAAVVAVVLTLLQRKDLLRQLLIASCLIVGLVVAMLPWWVRNARVTGRFVPTTLQVGASLYDGLSPEATGASNMDFTARFLEQELQGDENIEPAESLEIRLDRRMRSESLAWAGENPGQALRLAGVKFLRMWNIWPNEPSLSSWPIRLAVLFTYTPLLFFAIMGAWRTFDRGWPYIVCWLPAVYFTALHTVFVSSIRYREPAMLALLALAAGAIEMFRRREIRG